MRGVRFVRKLIIGVLTASMAMGSMPAMASAYAKAQQADAIRTALASYLAPSTSVTSGLDNSIGGGYTSAIIPLRLPLLILPTVLRA